ncbi:MAG: pitrilysin family protein [Planctomycetota bacterium]
MIFAANSASAAETTPIIPPFKLWKDVSNTELKPFKAPAAERFVLDNGLVIFLLEDHELPLIDLTLMARVGAIHEPMEHAGLAEATVNVMRSGGSAKYPGDTLDALLEDMGASISLGMRLDSASGSLATLKEDFVKGLDIFADLLRRPLFPEEKLELHLAQARTAISKRNDNPAVIAGREFRRAIYGEKSPYAKVIEYATLNELDCTALRKFHATYFQPNMFILGVNGDFKKEEMLAQLRAVFGDWPAQKIKLPNPQSISTSKKQKTLYCERPTINQTTLILGHILDLRRNHKDYPAIQLLNEILSGGMSARLFTEIRARRGLAYSVQGYANINYDRPGVFSCQAQTRNEQALNTVAALKEELIKLREHGVTMKEVAEAREAMFNSDVFNFDTPAKILKQQMTYEFYNYPLDFTQRSLEAIKQVSAEEVSKAARKYLDPDKCVLLAVGNFDGLKPPDTIMALKNAQPLDITIPLPQTKPMVIDPDREEKGKRILAGCMKASGGIQAFKSVRTVRAKVLLGVKALGRELKLNGILSGQMPDNVRMDVEGPFGPISQIMTKDAAWKVSGSSVESLKPQEARKNLRTLVQSDLGLLCILACAQEGYNVQALDPARDEGRDLLGVEIESQSLGRVKIWFDAQTKLLVKMRYVAEGAQKEYDKLFSDHANCGAITLARLIVDKDPVGPQSIQILQLEINPALNADLFRKPERATAP